MNPPHQGSLRSGATAPANPGARALQSDGDRLSSPHQGDA